MKFEPVPIGPQSAERKYFGVKLNIEDLDIEHKDKLEPYLIVHVRTYLVLCREGNKPERFREVLGAANWYLENRATDEDKKSIAQFYALAGMMIKEEMPKYVDNPREMLEFIKRLGQMYLTVVESCKLKDAFSEYAHNFVQVQDISEYGKRPQDTADLTFSLDEMYELMDLAYLCKMCAPIFGELILNMPDRYDGDGNKKYTLTKERRVSNFLTPLIQRYFLDVDEKTRYYVEHFVKTQCKDEAASGSSAPVFSGFITSTRVSWIMSTLLVRNFVGCDIERRDSNIVRYVDTMAHSHVITQNNTANRNQVRQRLSMSSMGSGDDSNNDSQMETDSVVSDRPLDVAIIVSTAVKRTIDDFLVERQITHAELDECVNWLMKHPVAITPLNHCMICAIMGHKIGGGRGVDLIKRENYTRLAALIQLIAFQMGMFEIGHAMTASKTGNVRILEGDDEVRFRNSYRTSFDYSACRNKFDASSRASNESEWDRQMQDICNDIVQNIYTYNTPPFILDHLSTPDCDMTLINGRPIPTDVKIINEMCTFINMYGH